jgi:outer membrane protein TolC
MDGCVVLGELSRPTVGDSTRAHRAGDSRSRGRDGPQAAAIRASVEVTRREQAARMLFPNPSVSYTREDAGFTEFLQGEQLLPISGTRGTLARAGVAAVEAAEAERDAQLWMLREDARQAVARVLAEQQRLADTERAVADIERLGEMLRTREQEGEGSRFDRVGAEQQRADERQLALIAAVAVATARAELTTLLPRDMELTRVSGTRATGEAPPLDTLLERAGSARAELRALQRAASRFSHEADAARRAQRLTPTVMGGFKPAEDIDRRASPRRSPQLLTARLTSWRPSTAA